MKEWISFKINDRHAKRKTDSWEVWSLESATHLGTVRWWSPWRRYCFYPRAGTVWEQDCLRSIATFIENATAEQRKGRRAFPKDPA